MAKGKPNLAFLEALKHEKRRRGDNSPGGAFKTPEWFNKTAPTAEPRVTIGPAQSARKPFRFTYVHGAIAATILIVAVVAIIVVARRGGSATQTAATDTPQTPTAHGNVMDPTGRVAVAPVTPATPATPAAPAPRPQKPVATPPAAAPAQPPAAAPAASGTRNVGQYYVVFQSYKDEKLAIEARDALAAGGLGASVEKGLDYAPTWYVVLGTQGFPRPNTADYNQYLAKAKVIGDKFAGKNKWRQFEPNPYKWHTK